MPLLVLVDPSLLHHSFLLGPARFTALRISALAGSNERRAVSGEPRTARSAGAEKRKKKETAVVFLIFSICRL